MANKSFTIYNIYIIYSNIIIMINNHLFYHLAKKLNY